MLGAAAFLAWLLLFSNERSFDVRGRVAGFGDDGRTLIVEHEAVPGYMPAMTMPFTARDTAGLGELESGDAVGFRLVVTPKRSWIEGIERLPQDAVAAHPAGENVPQLVTGTESRLLRAGDAVPDVALVDQEGEPLRLSDYDGQALVLSFIYTRCPIPDYCPLMSHRFQAMQPQLKKAFGTQAQLLSVSFDPEHDTPEVLADYAARYTDDTSTWTFATGTPEKIGRATSLFGVYTEGADGQIVHNLTTALIGPDGRLVQVWRGNDWSPDDVRRAVARVLASN